MKRACKLVTVHYVKETFAFSLVFHIYKKQTLSGNKGLLFTFIRYFPSTTSFKIS